MNCGDSSMVSAPFLDIPTIISALHMGDHSNYMWESKQELVYLCCDVFIPIHCCIYPYLIEYLYLTCIPMLLIFFHTSPSLCSEVFIPIHCCIYRCLIEYLYLCGILNSKDGSFEFQKGMWDRGWLLR